MSNENFYSYLHGEGMPFSQDESMLEHDKRYHPHGYHKGDKCEKRDSLERVDDVSSIGHVSEDEYYKPIMESFTPDSAREWLLERMGVECYHITGAEQTKKELGFKNLDYAEFKFRGKPVSKELYDRNCVLMAATCKDLKQRFSSFALDYPLFLPYDFYTKERPWYASSTLDRRNGNHGESYISLGNIDAVFNADLQEEYLRPSSRYAIVRHEIGHNISTENVATIFSHKILSHKGRYKEIKDIFGRSVERDREEAIAEIFSHCSSPTYRHGLFPVCLEEFFRKMIELTSKQGIVMDSNTFRKETTEDREHHLPFWFSVAVDFIHSAPAGKIAWYDTQAGKYVDFNSHEELLRYAMSKMEIPDSWTNEILTAFPQNDWGGWEIGIIRDAYWWAKKSLSETIADLDIFVRNK